MKVFISWSGETSHKVAISLRDWLPSVIQSIKPYVSSEDIDKGARWSSDIASELDSSSFGILCVTSDNVNAPWLNFEAGALGKTVDKSKVCPFLFKIKRSDVKGPILQYQSTINDKNDIFKLLKSINESCEDSNIDEKRLIEIYDVWWPKLEEKLSNINSNEKNNIDKSAEKEVEGSNISDVMEEILELSRTNQKLLRDPETLLPPDYFEFIFNKKQIIGDNKGETFAKEDLFMFYEEMINYIADLNGDTFSSKNFEELQTYINKLGKPIRYLCKKRGRRITRLYRDV